MSRGYPSLVLFDFDTYLLSDFYLLLPVNASDNYDTSIQLLANNKMSNTRLVACWLEWLRLFLIHAKNVGSS